MKNDPLIYIIKLVICLPNVDSRLIVSLQLSLKKRLALPHHLLLKNFLSNIYYKM